MGTQNRTMTREVQAEISSNIWKRNLDQKASNHPHVL